MSSELPARSDVLLNDSTSVRWARRRRARARRHGGTDHHGAEPGHQQVRPGAAGGTATPSAVDLQKMYDQPAYAGPRPTTRYMTLDDVVQRTGAMLGVLLVAGAVNLGAGAEPTRPARAC